MVTIFSEPRPVSWILLDTLILYELVSWYNVASTENYLPVPSRVFADQSVLSPVELCTKQSNPLIAFQPSTYFGKAACVYCLVFCSTLANWANREIFVELLSFSSFI